MTRTVRSGDAVRLGLNGRRNGLGGTNGAHDGNRKLRGGFYTPPPIAEFLARWAIRSTSARVLEPSAGDGQVVEPAARRLRRAGHVVAVELYEDEAAKGAARGGGRTTVVVGDFFTWFRREHPDGAFDAVVGNPPFVRYQDFPEEHRQGAFEIMREEGLGLSRLTNAWLPFVVGATKALRTGGRLALVLPAELLQVSYAAGLREYLARKYTSLSIVTFRRLVFDGIQQEIVLLLGVREDSPVASISFVELDDPSGLSVEAVDAAKPVTVDLDHARQKWTQYYLSPTEVNLLRQMEQAEVFGRLGDFAEVDVGIVTGRNEFFVLTEEEAAALGVREWCLPMVGRSAQIPGLVLRRREWQRLTSDNARTLLLQLGDVDRDSLPEAALRYVRYGERQGFHRGYKCRIRLPTWWNVPSIWEPDAFLLRQIHDAPRIIDNRAGATCTDTIHRVRTRTGVKAGWLAGASLNSLTCAFAEIMGRSYGGGVLELEPTEAEHLVFPRPGTALPVAELDTLAREGGAQPVMDRVDGLLLRPAGLTKADTETLRGIWLKLFQRRAGRR